MAVLKGEINKEGGKALVQIFGEQPPASLKNQKRVTVKEAKIIGSRFFEMLEGTAKKCGYEAEQSWDGKIYGINVAIPPEMQELFTKNGKAYENLIEISIDKEDLSKSVAECYSSAFFNRDSPLHKKFFLEGYLQEIMNGVKDAISLMEANPRKEPKLLK